MSQELYHQLSRLALAKAIKTPDDNDPYSEPWSKSIIFTQPFAVALQKKAQAFDINQRNKSIFFYFIFKKHTYQTRVLIFFLFVFSFSFFKAPNHKENPENNTLACLVTRKITLMIAKPKQK
jgi:hypothetical protein